MMLVMSLARPGKGESAAAALPLELSWDAPAGCPDALTVTRRVEQILRGPPAAPVTVFARAKITGPSEGRYHLVLTLRTADVEETREIDAASCSALAEASAVVVALAIDPSKDGALLPAEETPQPPTPPPAPSPAPPPPTKPAPSHHHTATPRQSPPSTRLAIGAGGAVVSGMLPELGGGLIASGTLRFERFRVGLVGSYWVPQRASFGRNAGASFEMVEVGAFGGYLVPLGRFALGPSANLEVTHVDVKGFGIRAPRTSSTLWPTVALGARAEAQVASWFGVFARTDLLFPIGAPAFGLATDNASVRLHDPSLFSVRLSLGIEIVVH
ncbi:MAG: hypothetical protein K0S65_874 [Labilithrix sp.]|nr:hypothetical protein [Labilithrix sp.]